MDNNKIFNQVVGFCFKTFFLHTFSIDEKACKKSRQKYASTHNPTLARIFVGPTLAKHNDYFTKQSLANAILSMTWRACRIQTPFLNKCCLNYP